MSGPPLCISHPHAKLALIMGRLFHPHLRCGITRAILEGLCCLHIAAAQAWTLDLNSASRRVFLQVGNGSLNANNSQINEVSVTVPGSQLGTGAAQQMSSNSTQATSPYDNYLVCTPPSQVYVGGSYQRNGNGNGNGPAVAQLQVASPANLTSAAGDTIPFSQISWTTSTVGNADATPNVIAPGTFNGATQTLKSIPANQFMENCHTFFYANSALRAAGTYQGTVIYTLSTP
ncbi:MAG: hypothetical protein JWP96_619 [Polaromonas sp.]|nr:hypothetical protein [Polaromonas sp.]